MKKNVENLCAYLAAAPSVYHAQAALVEKLEGAGYQPLSRQASWTLSPGGKYYLCQGGTAVVAFAIPAETPKGFLLSASHSDRPCLKLKRNFEVTGKYTRLSVEKYGGMIFSTWLDRPLSIAGRVLVETAQGAETKLLNIDRDLLLIPSVAIHMNRQVNDGYKWNPAVDLLPLLGGEDAAGKLWELLEEAAGGKILSHDLYLYVRQKPSIWGLNNEYIAAQALDDLECAWGCTEGFLNASFSQGEVPVLCVFDSEEVGSCSPQGAGSTLLADTLERIARAMGWDLSALLAGSFMVSADNAHALHPNHPELSDAGNVPLPGKGIVVKYSASLSYCTDGLSAAVFDKICQGAQVPTQAFHNRSDMVGGSTLGRISLGQVSVPTVDIGLAQLAMHSCVESAHVQDAIYLADAMTAFYSSDLCLDEAGFCLG